MHPAKSGKTQKTTKNKEKRGKTINKVETELRSQGKRLGLHYNKKKDQTLPEVERNHSNPEAVDDRPGARVELVRLDEERQQVLYGVVSQVESMSETEVKIMGATLAKRCQHKAEVLVSTLAGMDEASAIAAVRSATLVYPDGVKEALGRGFEDHKPTLIKPSHN